MKAINLSIVQGSGVGPCLFIILIADLRPAETTNHLVKYADDATLLVPEIHSNSLEEEFFNVQKWAILNKLTINMSKTKEMVFHRPSPDALCHLLRSRILSGSSSQSY